MIESQKHLRRVYGVDFSGAKNAGKKLWISAGIMEGGVLHIEDCFSSETLVRSGRGLDKCLAALHDFIAKEKECIFGLDFPFGLPKELIKENSWEKFVLSFPSKYPNPDKFKDECLKTTKGKECKRVTDKINRTPFSPYNLWLYKQTYFGIHDILSPLVRNNLVCVVPMQNARSGKPWLIEICPASTLIRMNLYNRPYKGRSDRHRKAREIILKAFEKTGIYIPEKGLCTKVLENHPGDALDSIIAAYAAFCAYRNNFVMTDRNEIYSLEGYVYA